MYSRFLIGIIIIALTILVFILTSCAKKAIPVPSITLDEKIKVERNDDDEYDLKFKDAGKYTIYANKNKDKIDWENPLITIDGDEVTFSQFRKDRRMYFGILDEKGERHIVSERHIKMRGTPNFRDIGGIKTKDGRTVSWGNIYRSGHLAKLKNDDLSYMKDLNIKHVCDFRYSSEIEEDPDRLPEGAKYHHFPIGGKEGLFYQEIKRKVTKEKLRGKEAKKEFIKVMELFADSAANDFKPVMDLLSDTTKSNAPLLYHCSGGKDRTGYMTMMILATLGVDKKTIKKEYLMSNYYRYSTNKSIARKGSIIGVDPETLSYILVVQEDYFDAVFKVIEKDYDGLDNYLLVKYDITPEIRQRMIEKYTVAPQEVVTLEVEEDVEVEAKPDKKEPGQ